MITRQMKLVVLVLFFAGCSLALPVQELVNYETDHQSRKEWGVPGELVEGYYTWQTAGRSYRVDYKADNAGFVSQVSEPVESSVQPAATADAPAEPTVIVDFPNPVNVIATGPAEYPSAADTTLKVPAEFQVPTEYLVPVDGAPASASEYPSLVEPSVKPFDVFTAVAENPEDPTEIPAVIAASPCAEAEATIAVLQFLQARQNTDKDVAEVILEEAVEDYFKSFPEETLSRDEIREIMKGMLNDVLNDPYIQKLKSAQEEEDE